MSEPTVGSVVDTARGRGTLIALTPMQARVQPADGDDPYWTLRSGIAIVDQVDEEREPTMRELLDNARACLEVVSMKLAEREAKEQSDAAPT